MKRRHIAVKIWGTAVGELIAWAGVYRNRHGIFFVIGVVMKFIQQERVALFIDGANLYATARAL